MDNSRREIMNEYLQFKRTIQTRVEILEEAIQEADSHGVIESAAVARWHKHLALVKSSLQDALLRIAVVGSVKSGKSTLINALAGHDLLKRGAGIVTAFITRVLSDNDVGGWIELKTWEQALDELNAVVRAMPAFQEEDAGGKPLDIRVEEDREKLRLLVEKTRVEWLQRKGSLDAGFIILKGFMDGYESLASSIGEQVNRLILDRESLHRHQRYVGHEGPAVYVRDVELHYPFPWLGEKVEIADCQGSDSPNPLHFELLQQYLLGSHFILYVISSRTGLREADFKLIDFIKTLRMFPQTSFVLNVDLDVHTSEEELQGQFDRVRSELEWVVPNPRLFSFSALHQLVGQLGANAPEKERRRMELWREDRKLAEASENGFASFREHLERRIGGQRARILLGSGMSRLSMVAGSVLDTARVHRQYIARSPSAIQDAARQLDQRRPALRGTLVTLANAISGLNDSLRREVGDTVDRYFDPARGRIVRETLEMVEHFAIDAHTREELGDHRQVLRQLYRFYIEFRQSLSRYLVERVNLRVIEFAKTEEASLKDRLNRSSRAFWTLFAAAVAEYRRDFAQSSTPSGAADEPVEYDWPGDVKIVPPAFSAFLDREAIGRGVLLMKFGLGRFARFIGSLRTHVSRHQDLLKAEPQREETVAEAIRLVKAEAGTELLRAFQHYRDTFKTVFLFRMLDEATLHLLEEFRTRAEMAQMDLADLLERREAEGAGLQLKMDAIDRCAAIAEAMVEELDGLRCAVNSECPLPEVPASTPEQERSEPAPNRASDEGA